MAIISISFEFLEFLRKFMLDFIENRSKNTCTLNKKDKILLYMSRILKICLYCTLYMRKICKVKCTYTFVHERKIEFMYNPGYRMTEKEYLAAKLDYGSKEETKDELVEQLMTLIQENEERKKDKLESLVKKLDMDAGELSKMEAEEAEKQKKLEEAAAEAKRKNEEDERKRREEAEKIKKEEEEAAAKKEAEESKEKSDDKTETPTEESENKE